MDMKVPQPRLSTSTPSVQTHLLQRACACGQHTGGGECTECEKQRETGLQRAAVGAGPQVAPPIVHEVLRGSGQPLDVQTRALMEPRFGHDFSRVRVHTDARAAQSARAVNALASTIGRDVVFGAGQYAPGTHAGQRLVAHELTHVVQQSAQSDDQGRSDPVSPKVGQQCSANNHHLSPKKACVKTGQPGVDNPEPITMLPDQTTGAVRTSDELSGAPSACVAQAAMPYSRSGIIRSPMGSVTEKFEVQVEWTNHKYRGGASYCAAECGEYHQFVKGYAKSSPNQDGSNLTNISAKLFGGKLLDPNVFQEDGLDNNPLARYGHRKEKQTMNEKYDPDRATGNKYTGKDEPGVLIGTFADFDLTFMGKLVDTCNSTEIKSDPWRVAYRGIIRP